MELVLVELDAGTELDATECSEVTDAELVGGTDLNSGCGRRIECGRDERRESELRASGTSGGGAGERSLSRDGGRRGQGQHRRVTQAESIRAGYYQ